MCVVSEDWRERQSSCTKLEKNYNEEYEMTPWRAWVMVDDDGRALGYFTTEEAAKKALQEEVSRLIAE